MIGGGLTTEELDALVAEPANTPAAVPKPLATTALQPHAAGHKGGHSAATVAPGAPGVTVSRSVTRRKSDYADSEPHFRKARQRSESVFDQAFDGLLAIGLDPTASTTSRVSALKFIISLGIDKSDVIETATMSSQHLDAIMSLASGHSARTPGKALGKE